MPRKPMMLLLACLLAASVSACQNGVVTDCLTFEPICPSSQDVLTEGTARQILAHNERGEAVCNWTP